MGKIGFVLMPSQDHKFLKNIYFHYVISNTIFTWNIKGPKNCPFLESMLHLFVRLLHICSSTYAWHILHGAYALRKKKGTEIVPLGALFACP